MNKAEKLTTRVLLLRALAELSEVRGQLAALNSQLQRQAEAGAALRTKTADPQTLIERAIMARQAELRAQAGG